MFPPRVFEPMFRPAGDTANQVADALEIEAAIDFALDQIAHQSGFASLPGNGSTLQRVPLLFRETNGESRFHPIKI